MNQTWEEFVYEYIDTGWFYSEDRPKTTEAMKHLFERVPPSVWAETPLLSVFAPSPHKRGQLFPFKVSPAFGALIYLAPSLEYESQDQVDFTVAHEFAHALLGHHLPGNNDTSLSLEEGLKISAHEEAPSEVKADSVAKSWGFRLPVEGQNP